MTTELPGFDRALSAALSALEKRWTHEGIPPWTNDDGAEFDGAEADMIAVLAAVYPVILLATAEALEACDTHDEKWSDCVRQDPHIATACNCITPPAFIRALSQLGTSSSLDGASL